MRSVFSRARRAAAVLAVVASLLVPVAGFADDPEIRPPLPTSVMQPAAPGFWQILLLVVRTGFHLPIA
jgi:hypothetical protein